MTPELILFLKKLVEIRKAQTADSQYFAPKTGGTYSSKLAGMTGLTWQEVESYGADLEAQGYAKVLTRDSKESFKGIQVTDDGVLFVEGVELAEKQSADLKAASDAQLAREKDINDFLTEAQRLGWDVKKVTVN